MKKLRDSIPKKEGGNVAEALRIMEYAEGLRDERTWREIRRIGSMVIIG